MSLRIVLAVLIVLGAASCKRADAVGGAGPQHGDGRYQGVGLFEPGRMWRELVPFAQTRDPAEARLSDDERVIVVVDSRTGEIRQCGNLSGYCLTSNPWSPPAKSAQAAPARLVRHADDIDREAGSTVAPAAIKPE
jgi:hypothetical protein